MCFLSNAEEINLLLSLFKKAKNKNFDFCYLMANNQLKWGIIYEKIVLQAGNDEQVIMNGLTYITVLPMLFIIFLLLFLPSFRRQIVKVLHHKKFSLAEDKNSEKKVFVPKLIHLIGNKKNLLASFSHFLFQKQKNQKKPHHFMRVCWIHASRESILE